MFATTVAAEQARACKPNPGLFRFACQKLGIGPGDLTHGCRLFVRVLDATSPTYAYDLLFEVSCDVARSGDAARGHDGTAADHRQFVGLA